MPNIEIKPALWRDSPHLFEQYIIVACNTNSEFWYKVAKHLCHQAGKDEFVNHFEDTVTYIMYRALHYWREMVSGSTFAPISEGGLLVSLYQLSQMTPPLLAEEQVATIATQFKNLQNSVLAEEAYIVVRDDWRVWLQRKRNLMILTDCRRRGADGVDDALQQINASNRELNKADGSQDETFWDMSMLQSHSEEIVERMPLSKDFRNINSNLGGGLGKTEHIMFVAPTGAGKTTFACQLAVDIARARKGVLLLSTEQHPLELYPRFISNMSYKMQVPIPFRLIKDGISDEVKKALSPQQANAIPTIVGSLGSLIAANWGGDKNVQSISEHVDKVAERLSKVGCSLDCVILDWIGGALTEGTADPGKKRLLMNDAADKMKDLAKEYNIATVSMAQTSAKGIDVHKVTEQHLAESKTIHYAATAAFGISAVRVNTESENEDAYDTKQHIYCFKSRKDKGRYFTIRRNFDYQRFEDL